MAWVGGGWWAPCQDHKDWWIRTKRLPQKSRVNSKLSLTTMEFVSSNALVGSGSGSVVPRGRGLTLREAEEQREKIRLEKKAKAESLALFELLQQKKRLKTLVEKRLAVFRYVRSIHENSTNKNGGVVWLNSVVITQLDIKRFTISEIPSSRTRALYYLSISLQKLLEKYGEVSDSSSNSNKQTYVPSNSIGSSVAAPNGTSRYTLMQCLLQLFEEWEFHFLGNAYKSLRLVLAKAVSSVHPSISSQESNRQMEILVLKKEKEKEKQRQKSPFQFMVSKQKGKQGQGETADMDKEKAKDNSLVLMEQYTSSSADINTNSDAAGTCTDADTTEISKEGPTLKASLFKFHGNVVYEHLVTPRIPLDLCYSELIIDFSNTLEWMYSLFFTEDTSSLLSSSHLMWTHETLYESIQKIDKRINDQYIKPCLNEVTMVATRKSENIFELLRSGVP